MSWDGINRRQSGQEDHDLIIKINADLSNFMRRFDDFVNENRQDHEKVKKRIAILERAYWVAVGAIIIIQLVIKSL